MTTSRPYTDDDLRSEAGLCHDSLSKLPTPEEIAHHLREAYMPSRTTDDATPTWGDLLSEDQLKDAAHRIKDLMTFTAPVSTWGVALGADGLEPSPDVINLDGDNGPVIRIHFAFAPDMPLRARQQFALGLAQAIADNT
ncbi:hypothetical protein JK361_22680 [Streptomyces sp. 5-8]|uniref:Uncharacterized protein n=1 Tax=Streptomyces musisoli TaxID=2802280 RepID=A0ABS1P4T4_9ACTN|nr:hypothetical protein [Streptomyces musisoli]MBL1107376.1 hypothetical protein [Streptomyces musisoli]